MYSVRAVVVPLVIIDTCRHIVHLSLFLSSKFDMLSSISLVPLPGMEPVWGIPFFLGSCVPARSSTSSAVQGVIGMGTRLDAPDSRVLPSPAVSQGQAG